MLREGTVHAIEKGFDYSVLLTVWLAPLRRLNAPPETTLNGAAVDAVPLRVPLPPFVTVNG